MDDILWALPADLDPMRTHLASDPSRLPLVDSDEDASQLAEGIRIPLTPIRDFGTFGLEIDEEGEFQFDSPCPETASLFRIEDVAVAGSAQELVDGSDLHDPLQPGVYDVQVLSIGEDVEHEVFRADDGSLRLRGIPDSTTS